MNVIKLRAYMLLMIFGLILLFGGVQSLILAHQPANLTDDEIILRARELGMVELKEALEPK